MLACMYMHLPAGTAATLGVEHNTQPDKLKCAHARMHVHASASRHSCITWCGAQHTTRPTEMFTCSHAHTSKYLQAHLHLLVWSTTHNQTNRNVYMLACIHMHMSAGTASLLGVEHNRQPDRGVYARMHVHASACRHSCDTGCGAQHTTRQA